ncbi:MULTISPECIES: outer membrane protein assembly factor BamB [Arhodomonas]|nr:outer membrane protein assembly factor BamB [Arhodomonas aquaeolei]
MSRIARLSLALVLGSALVGCATPDAFEATDPPGGVSVAGGLEPEMVWSRDVGEAGGLHDRLEPAYSDERIYAAGADGTVYAFDAENGRTEWTQDLGAPLSGGPAAGHGLVVIGTRKGEVIGLSADDGEVLWRSGVTSEVLAPAAIGDDVVVVRTNDGRVFALEPDSGERRWLYDRNVPTLTVRGHSAPVIAEGGAIVGFDNGRLVALSLSEGTPVWEASVAVPKGQTDLDRMIDIDADPLVARDAAFAVAYQGRVAGVALKSGQVVWARELSGNAGLALAGRRLIVPDTGGRVWALDPSNGASLWRQDALSGEALAGPAIQDGYVVVAGDDGYLSWLNADSGEILARRHAADTRITVAPLVVGHRLYTLSTGGQLQSWSLPGS